MTPSAGGAGGFAADAAGGAASDAAAFDLPSAMSAEQLAALTGAAPRP